jgi:hypothetical protein
VNAQNEPVTPSTELGGGRILARAVALGLVVLGFLPIANWIADGHAASWYGEVLQTWLFGSAIVAGIVVVLVVLTRRHLAAMASAVGDATGRWFDLHPKRTALVISAFATAVYAFVAVAVFDAKPLFIDEIIQVYQARLLADGKLADVVGPFPEFFSALNVVTAGDRQFGQFPPGGPAHLLLGVLIGAPWIITPLLGGAAVYVFAVLVRRLESERAVALGAILLLAFSPFMIFMSASHMNHVPTMLWVLIAWLAGVRLTSQNGTMALWAGTLGLAIGVAGTIRPVDAVAMAAPVLVLWVLALRRKEQPWRELLAFAAGATVPALLLLAYNAATTGSPLLFGYELLWGKSHSLGFHESPWGTAHSPSRGLELLSLYALRLQSYLFESPTPSLLPVIAALAVTRRVTRTDAAILWAVVLLGGAYFAYWHDGFYLGPRFFFVLVPALALFAARAPRALGEFTGRPDVRRYAFVSLAASIIIGLTTSVPERARHYSRSLASSRHNLALPADSLGVRNALVFVRESWGSQVVARLWGRGIERSDAEQLYRRVDTCLLDSALTSLEERDIAGSAARSQLDVLLRDSAAVQPSTMSPDATERVLPGTQYSSYCFERIAEDKRGVALYPLVLAEARGSNLYARDLGARNVLLANRYPERRAFLLTRRGPDGADYVLQPLTLHSAASAR